MSDDVMAHVHTFGTVAPEAAGIIQYVWIRSRLLDGRGLTFIAWVPRLALSPSKSPYRTRLASY